MTSDSGKLRTAALKNRRAMSVAERFNASAKICNRFVASREFRSARRIACYLPMRDEVDPRAIIARAWRANKRVFLPVTLPDGEMFFREMGPDSTLVKNSMSIWEPTDGEIIDPKHLQLVVTPTVAFDEEKHRIGMGGGYYDRCFEYLRRRKTWLPTKLVGIAFECQKVEKITPNAWDIPLYRIITEKN